jgi:hypothetical protein
MIMPIKPIDLDKLEKTAENIYEAIVIASKRSRQINEELKMQMNTEIESISVKPNSDEEVESNPDMANISLKYEKLRKPTIQSLDEIFSEQLTHRYKDKEV